MLACSRACFRAHDRLDGIPTFQDMSDVGTFGGDGFGRGEAATGVVLRALNEAKLSRLLPPIELGSNLPIRRLAHAAPKRIAEDRSLVGDGLALEDAVAGEGDGLFRGELLCSGCAPVARARSRAAATTCCG